MGSFQYEKEKELMEDMNSSSHEFDENELEAIVIGGILGDSHVQKTRSLSQTSRLRFGHGIGQKDYLLWKYKVFEKWCLLTKGPKEHIQSGFPFISFYTSYDEKWTKYHNLFYERDYSSDKSGIFYKKRIPENLEDYLTHPLSLLVWYCDDGSKRTDCNAARIATQSFTYEEHLILQKCLLNNFRFHTDIPRAGKTVGIKQMYSLSIPAKTFVLFEKLVCPLIKTHVPSMSYKC